MRRLYSDQSGQSLVIIAIAMVALLGVAAITIDVGNWYVKRHQAQVAADAASLAAANCLADAGTSGDACTSATDTANATSVANAIALANGVTLVSGDVTFPSGQVSVTAPNPASGVFGGIFGFKSTNVSAKATASYTSPSTACSNPGSSCAAVFAMGSSCSNSSGDPGGSPIIFNGSGDTIQGIMHSNGSIYEAGGGNQTLGQTTFGNGSGCEIDTSNETGDTWGGLSTMPTTGSAPTSTWPDDYTNVVTNCGSGYAYACTGPGGTPSYCTNAAANYTFGSGETTVTQGKVWCAYGSGTVSQPSTWNGLLYFQSSSAAFTGNWIGGTIELGQNGFTLSPQLTSFPVLYATGAGNCSSASSGGVCMTGGNQTINGAIFAPNGWIQFNGGSSTSDNFLEGQYIDFIGGSNNILGDGPTSLGGSSGSGGDSLTN